MRKLTLAALAYTAAVFVMHYWQPLNAVFITVPFCIALFAFAWFLLRGKIRISALIVSFFVLLGVVRYETHYNQTVAEFEDYIGMECRITAEVCEYPVVYDDSVKYTVKLYTDLLPQVKAIIYDYTTTEAVVMPGERFRATVRLSSALYSSGEETDTYVSKGIYVRGYVADHIRPISEGAKYKYMPVYLARGIRDTISDYMPQRSAAFLAALMTGDKNALYADKELEHVLSTAALSHVVAVSGMHVSFVISLALVLFGQRRGWFVSVLLSALFAIMTGLSPSVIRAVFMQTLFLLAPVIRREADSITSISFALLILLVINPFAISSISLQLSFLSMTGIILVTPRAVEWFVRKCPITNRHFLKAYRVIAVSLSSSLGATVFTAPLCAYYFGTISVVAPLTNLLVLWIVPICFCVGFVLCFAAAAIPVLASGIGAVLNLCVSLFFAVGEQVASIPYAVVYLPGRLIVLWFALVYAVIALTFLFRKNGLYRPIYPLITAILSLALFVGWGQQKDSNGLTVAAIDVGQGQCVAILDGDFTIVADCGGDFDSGDTASRWLYTHSRKQVDVLIISHFDEDHVNGVLDLMLQIPVKEIIYCGNNVKNDDLRLFNEIRGAADRNHTKLTLVNTEAERQWGTSYTRLFAVDGESSNDGLITLLQSGGYELLVMGDADFAAESQLLRMPWLHEVDCLVVGHHGSAYSTGNKLLERISPEVAIISCGYNSYGHPSAEVLDRLSEKNVIIYRTDQMGSIEIKVR